MAIYGDFRRNAALSLYLIKS